MNKMRNIKTVVDDIVFDSKLEAEYYRQLKWQIMAGTIKSFELQVPFLIEINKMRICKYYADFVITNLDGTKEVIDTKGFITPLYRLKKKLVEAVYNIKIKEIYKKEVYKNGKKRGIIKKNI